jgi:hypothetical protein
MFRVAPLGAMLQLINRASKFRAHFAPKGATLNYSEKLNKYPSLCRNQARDNHAKFLGPFRARIFLKSCLRLKMPNLANA